MRKTLSLILAAVLVCCMYAMPAMAATYTAGTYTASAPGNNGPVEVSVTVSDSAITAVEVIAHNETAGLSDPAIEQIPAGVKTNWISMSTAVSESPAKESALPQESFAALFEESTDR